MIDADTVNILNKLVFEVAFDEVEKFCVEKTNSQGSDILIGFI